VFHGCTTWLSKFLRNISMNIWSLENTTGPNLREVSYLVTLYNIICYILNSLSFSLDDLVFDWFLIFLFRDIENNLLPVCTVQATFTAHYIIPTSYSMLKGAFWRWWRQVTVFNYLSESSVCESLRERYGLKTAFWQVYVLKYRWMSKFCPVYDRTRAGDESSSNLRALEGKPQCFSICYYVKMSTKSKTDSELSRVSFDEMADC